MRYELSLLRGFQLTADGAPVRMPGSARRLVAFLALQSRPLTRASVAGTLWPDSSEEHAHASLRSALWRTRRVGAHIVVVDAARLGLHRDLAVDRDALIARARRLIDRAAACEDADLWPAPSDHELLPGWGDRWLQLERERLRHLRLHALEALALRLSGLGRYADAVEVALEAVRSEPLRESAHRALIGVHLAEGNVAEARRQYAFCRRLLHAHLGVGPSARLVSMIVPAAA